MDFTGMLLGYKKNRPLKDEERKNQLKQRERLNFKPEYDLCVIRSNSTFLETVDRYYAWRGVRTFFALVFIAIFAVGDIFFLSIAWNRRGNPVFDDDLGFILFAGLVSSAIFGVCGWILFKENFTNTHFPIRLNRRTRKVYVFRPGRPDQPILVADWDKLFITMIFCGQGGRSSRDWDIRAHVMAEDGITVLDTFAFDLFWDKDDLDVLRGHWEFLRRYMEEKDGPQKTYELVEVCMPIADRQESLRLSLNRFYLNFAGPSRIFWWLLLPLSLLISLSRWISMQTSRVPVWPQAIEDECRIDPDDPFVRDESTNPKENFWAL